MLYSVVLHIETEKLTETRIIVMAIERSFILEIHDKISAI